MAIVSEVSGINVVANYGGNSCGMIPPALNMQTLQGRITGISGQLIELDSSGFDYYDHMIYISSGVAGTSWGWPNTSGYAFGMYTERPAGFVFNLATGMYFCNAGVPTLFSR